MNNEELKNLYEKVYSDGKENFFTMSTFDVSKEVLREIDWENKKVLEIGCGTGETANLIAEAGGKIFAIDYAFSSITEAKKRHSHPNLTFAVESLDSVQEKFDVIVAQEVIEHTDDPFEVLKRMKELMNENGTIIITCPNFLNLYGYICMTLYLLLDVPISLSDLHFLSPFDMEDFAKRLGLKCKWRTFRFGQAHGEDMITDLRKRLTNALRDANLDNSNVEILLDWFAKAARYQEEEKFNGAKALYRFNI